MEGSKGHRKSNWEFMEQAVSLIINSCWKARGADGNWKSKKVCCRDGKKNVNLVVSWNPYQVEHTRQVVHIVIFNILWGNEWLN